MSNRFLRTFRDKSHILGSSFGNRGAIFSLKLNPSSFGFFSPFLNRSVGFSSSSFFTSHFRHFPGCVRRIEVSPPHPGTEKSLSERADHSGGFIVARVAAAPLGRPHSRLDSGISSPKVERQSSSRSADGVRTEELQAFFLLRSFHLSFRSRCHCGPARPPGVPTHSERRRRVREMNTQWNRRRWRWWRRMVPNQAEDEERSRGFGVSGGGEEQLGWMVLEGWMQWREEEVDTMAGGKTSEPVLKWSINQPGLKWDIKVSS